MAKKIKKEDIIDGSLFGTTIDETREFIKLIQTLKKELGKLKNDSKSKIKGNPLGSPEDVKKFNKEQAEANAIIREGNRLLKAEVAAKAKLKSLTSDEAKRVAALKLEINERNRAIRQDIKLAKARTGSINEMRIALSKLTKQYDNLTKEERENAKIGGVLQKQIQQTRAEVGKLEEATGRHQRSVGQYGKALSKVTSILGGLGLALGGGAALGGIFRFNKELGQSEQLSRTFFNTTEEGIKSISREATILADIYEKDVKEVLQAANVLQKEFGLTGQESLSLIEQGFEKGLDASGQFLDNVREYSTQLKLAGLSADESFALIAETERRGVFSDKGIDAIKEAVISIREMTPATRQALQAIGISADQVQKDIQSGAKTYFQVIQEISKRTSEFGEQSQEAGAVLADVFRGAGEDAGSFIFQLGELNTSFENVNGTLSPFQQSLNNLVKEWNNFLFDLNEGVGVGSVLTSVLSFLASNLRTIFKVVTVAASAWASYKAGVIASNLATKSYTIATKGAQLITGLFTKGLKGANISFKALNTTMKANPIGLVVSALTTLITAFGLFKDAADDATESQKKFNEEQNKSVDGIEKRFAIRKKLNKQQLQDLKTDIENQLDIERKAAVESEANALELSKINEEASRKRIKELEARQEAGADVNMELQLERDLLRSNLQIQKERELGTVRQGINEENLSNKLKVVNDLLNQRNKTIKQGKKLNEDLYFEQSDLTDDALSDLEKELDAIKGYNQEKKDAEENLTSFYEDQFEKRYNAALESQDKQADATKESLTKQSDAIEKAVENTKQIVNAAAQSVTEFAIAQQQERLQLLDSEIQASKDKEDALLRAAETGNALAEESIALERKNRAKLEQERIASARRQRNIQLALAGFNTLSAVASSGSDNPAVDTINQITLLNNFLKTLPAFIDGTEKVSDGVKGAKKISNGTDGYLARFDGNERILNPQQNAMLEGVTNEELTMAGLMFKNGAFDYLNFGNKVYSRNSNSDSSIMLYAAMSSYSKKLDELNKSIKNIPQPVTYWNEIQKGITEQVETMNNIKTKHYKQGGLF